MLAECALIDSVVQVPKTINHYPKMSVVYRLLYVMPQIRINHARFPMQRIRVSFIFTNISYPKSDILPHYPRHPAHHVQCHVFDLARSLQANG